MNENARILIVEDDEHLLHATSRLLHGAGYKVVEATTGSDGLRLTREKQPDLVLLDVVLPDMDGLEVCRRIKADADLARTYVVLLSAIRTESDNQAAGLEAGADGYIARPISNRELLARVEALLRLRQAEEALRERTHQLDGRVKELNCLYGISRLVEKPATSLDEILQGTVDLLPPAWQYPGITCARIILKDQEFETDNFQETPWQQACDVQVSGNRAGRVEVFYLQGRPERDEGPFLEGERRLLNAVAERLGRIVERMQAEEALRDSEATARALLNTPADAAVLIDAHGFILDANETMARRFHLSADELIGLCFWDLLPPQVAESREAYVDQVIQSGKPLRFEDEREGTWFDSAVHPVLDARGQVSRVAVLARDVTERKQAEEALRAEKEFSETVLDTIMDSLFVFDPNTGEPIRWNKAFSELSGCTDEEIASKKAPDDWYSEEDLAKTKAETEKLFRGEKSIVVMSLITKDGRRIPTEYTASLIRDPEGKPRYIVAVGRDITERKRAEDALRESEQRYRRLFEQTLIGMVSLGRDGRISSANRAAGRILGYSNQEELVGQPAAQIGYDLAERSDALQAAREFGYVPVQEVTLRKKDGTPVVALATPIIDQDKDGKLLGITAMFTDITDRKRAEQTLKESEERYRAVASLTSDLAYAFRVEPDGSLVREWLTGAYERITGFSPEELEAQGGWARVIHPDDRPASQRHTCTLLSGQPHAYEFRILTRSGQVRWVHDSAWPEQDEGTGQVVRIYGAARNITDRKQAEEALRESEERLALAVEASGAGVYDHLVPVEKGAYHSERWANILGYTREELPPPDQFMEWLIDRIHPHDLHRLEKAYADFVEGRTPGYNVEIRTKHKSGEWICTQGLSKAVERDANGRVTRVVGVMLDITERKRAEEALRQSGRELGIRNQINSIFLAYPDEEMYSEVLKLVLATMSSEYGTFGYFDEHGSFVAPALTRQIYWERCDVPEKEIIFRKGTFGGIWGRAIEERKTLIANEGPFHMPQGHIPIKNTLVTPIVFRDQVISAIHLANKPGGYDEQDRATVEMIAAKIAPVLYARIQRDRRDKERRQAEDALRQSEERYRLLLESMSDSVYVLDPEWRHIVVNDAASRFVEMSRETLLKNKLTDLFPGIEETAFFQTFQRVMGTREPGVVTAEHAFPDGRKGWYEVHVDPVPEGILCISRDITDRVEAEEALRKSEEQYRDLVENISDVIYTLDTGGVITYASPAVESLVGYHPSEVVGRPFAQFIAPEDLHWIRSSFQKLAAGESPGPNEYRVVTKAGEVRWIRASSQPVVEEDQFTGVQGVLTDITDRKRAEEQLEEAAAAAERERLARELHDAVTQVLFSASLIADALPRVWERHPEEGLRGVEEVRRLTHGALAEMRMLLLELRPAALREQELDVLLRQLADAMMARTRMPVTTTVVGECTPPTEVKIGLYRIAQEALNNVAKHAQASRATVSLHCEPNGATLRITDNGRGFDPDTVQPHHLGVAIMHERAQAIGATLNIESRPGQGTEIAATWSSAGETDGE